MATLYYWTQVCYLSVVLTTIASQGLTNPQNIIYGNHEFCEIQDKKFQSIFNLGNDLIFQTKTQFLKLNNSIDTDEALEKYPSRSARFYADNEMRLFLASMFVIDTYKPVHGFTYQFMSNDCGSLDVLNECTEVYDDSQIFYACIYGTDSQTNKFMWFGMKYNNSRLMILNTPALKSRVTDYCGHKWKHPDTNLAKEGFFSGVSFRLPHPEVRFIEINVTDSGNGTTATTGGYGNTTSVYPTTGYNDTGILFVPYYEDKITYQIFTAESMAYPNTVNLIGYQFCKVYDSNLTDAKYLFHVKYYLPKSEIYYVFRYLNITWSCGQNCNLDTPLSLIQLEHNILTTSLTSQMFGTNQTLKTLFGCGRYQYDSFPLFKPNDFCGTDQRLESVFGLGNDLYFQNNAKFWKWSDVSFKSGANPGIKSEPIFFDSEFTTILNKFHIDTTKPVMGFTFKLYSSLTSNVNECLTNADTIRCQLYLNPDYYRACIYAEVIDDNTIGKLKDDFERKAFAFQYTPSGLKAFPPFVRPKGHPYQVVSKETQAICETIRNAFKQKHPLLVHSMRLQSVNASHLIIEMIATNTNNELQLLEIVVLRNKPIGETTNYLKHLLRISDMNPLSNINHRIIGYSYLLNNNTYRTIIIGRSNWKTSKQFNSQSIYGVFDLKTGPLNHMIPNNKGSNDLPFSVHTIDAFDKQYLQNNITSDTILAIAYLQNNQSVDQYKEWYLNPVSIILDRKDDPNIYHFSKRLSALEFPGNSTPFSEVFSPFPTGYGRNRFTKILGMFSYNKIFYLLVFPKDISYPVVYQISVFNHIEHLTLDGFEFNVFFNCPIPPSSVSTTGRRAMNVLLVLLLISLVIVIVIALIVAFVKHRNNESKTKPVTNKNDKDIASDAKNAQKPSTTPAKANPEVQSPTTTEPNIQTPSKLEAEVPKSAKSDSIESKRSLF
ncbi:unnamed protein product [Medioppia subpectinata]|uniref:Uncharacterized protein n=1 Tax=Medioppia subpectinata TaxID=1979941 RepID=A0A7R9KQ56_9ACAR|nr:unnamed protein product [Medioppia subpectinata]CAG2107752.1 unnamed protein product [Medioppia subpectinata]